MEGVVDAILLLLHLDLVAPPTLITATPLRAFLNLIDDLMDGLVA
jgi:hypothetical protein